MQRGFQNCAWHAKNVNCDRRETYCAEQYASIRIKRVKAKTIYTYSDSCDVKVSMVGCLFLDVYFIELFEDLTGNRNEKKLTFTNVYFSFTNYPFIN